MLRVVTVVKPSTEIYNGWVVYSEWSSEKPVLTVLRRLHVEHNYQWTWSYQLYDRTYPETYMALNKRGLDLYWKQGSLPRILRLENDRF